MGHHMKETARGCHKQGSTTVHNQVDRHRALLLNLKSSKQKWIPKGMFPTQINGP